MEGLHVTPTVARPRSRPMHSDRTAGDIIVPDSARKKSQRAEMIAVGAGAQFDKGAREP